MAMKGPAEGQKDMQTLDKIVYILGVLTSEQRSPHLRSPPPLLQRQHFPPPEIVSGYVPAFYAAFICSALALGLEVPCLMRSRSHIQNYNSIRTPSAAARGYCWWARMV